METGQAGHVGGTRRLLLVALAGVAGALYIRDLGLGSAGAAAVAALASASSAEAAEVETTPFFVDPDDVSVRIATCVS